MYKYTHYQNTHSSFKHGTKYPNIDMIISNVPKDSSLEYNSSLPTMATKISKSVAMVKSYVELLACLHSLEIEFVLTCLATDVF